MVIKSCFFKADMSMSKSVPNEQFLKEMKRLQKEIDGKNDGKCVPLQLRFIFLLMN